MPIYDGDKKIKDLYFNNEKIKEGYYGDKLVYSSEKPHPDEKTEFCFNSNATITFVITAPIGTVFYVDLYFDMVTFNKSGTLTKTVDSADYQLTLPAATALLNYATRIHENEGKITGIKIHEQIDHSRLTKVWRLKMSTDADLLNLFYNNKSLVFSTDFLPEEGEYKKNKLELPNTTNLQDFFSGCTNLGPIDRTFLDLCVSLTNVTQFFRDCTTLSSIVNLLFKYTPISIANLLFYNCTGLTTVPTQMFVYNYTTLTSVDFCFYNCTALTSNVQQIFIAVSAIANLTHVGYCFYNCSKVTGNGTNLITIAFSNATSHNYCFGGCTSLSDYNNLPSGWK
jgi:hypothetical protein